MKINLKKFGTILTSRQLGKEAILALQVNLKNLSKNEKLEIDFEGVVSLSPSWADEFFRPLFKKYGDRLILKNTDNVSVKATMSFLEEIGSFKLN